MTQDSPKQPLVRQQQNVEPIECPFGHVQRIVTGGEGDVANVRVVKVTKGLPHVHDGYDEVYYFLSGTGTITLGDEASVVGSGAVAVIPTGVPHSLEADQGVIAEKSKDLATRYTPRKAGPQYPGRTNQRKFFL